MQINISSNLDKVQQKLEQLSKKGQNLKPLMAEVANLLQQTTEESFENQTSPDGTPWADLDPKTKKSKKGKPLYESGRMQESLSVFSTASSAGAGFNAKAKNGFPYPAVHQFGSEHVPARPFLPIDQDGDISGDLREGILDLAVEFFES